MRASGVVYVYYDPDVLPEGVKRFLPIKAPEGKGMTLEEYEKWRAQQSGYPTQTQDTKKEEAKEERCVRVCLPFVALSPSEKVLFPFMLMQQRG